MNRRTLSVWITAAGLILGLVGMAFFFQRPLGVSFPLFIGLAVGTVLVWARRRRAPVNWHNLWPLAPLTAFALMVAVRAQLTVMMLNVGATLALGALALAYMRRAQRLDTASTVDHVWAVIVAGLNAAFGAPAELGRTLAWLRERSWHGRVLIKVARGLLIGLPVVALFAVLLGMADVVFGDYIASAWELLTVRSSPYLFGQIGYVVGIAWLAVGAIAWGVARGAAGAQRYVVVPGLDGEPEAVPLEITNEDDDAPAKPKRGGLLRLSMIEAGIVLGLVNLLFAAFVLVQFTYFFGGADFIEARGLTYAEYARRGFFELVAVSVLTLGLALWLNRFTVRPSARDRRVFRALAAALVALMSVMLVSAWQRMLLYEEAYGFTHLRVYARVATLWLGTLFAAFLLEVFQARRNAFALGLLLAAIGYLGTLNLMNVDLYIAERNIARYRDGRALDLGFLAHLSLDAAPAVVPLHAALAARPEAQAWTGQWLARELRRLDWLEPGETVFTANIARSAIGGQLDALRDSLPVYDPHFFYSGRHGGHYNIYEQDNPGQPPITPIPSGAADD
ncbi:MAG: DUF4153 domain-containing protein [Aggregatilineales bacterium]